MTSAERPRQPNRASSIYKGRTYWVENIASPNVRENTAAGYRVAVNTHLVPGVGAHRLDKLEPEHLERLYQKMIKAGSSPGIGAVGLPAELVALMEKHRDEQAGERELAGQLWRDSGYGFHHPAGMVARTTPDIPPRRCCILGVPERAVIGLMGWSTTAMAARYQHITGRFGATWPSGSAV